MGLELNLALEPQDSTCSGNSGNLSFTVVTDGLGWGGWIKF